MRKSLLALTATALLLAGCTDADEPEAGGTQAPEQAEAAQDAATDLQAAAGEDAEPTALPADLPVLATRATTDGSTPLEIDLNAVTVSGDVMTVLFTARNLGDDNWQISEYFDDSYGTAPLDTDGARSDEHQTRLAFSTDGVAVLDPVNGTMHRAAYDTAGNCACNVDLSSRFVGAGEQVVLTTAFAAVPDDVETVTVQIPGAGAFDDVPVTR